MRKEEIHYFPTQNETKASTSERAILTIKPRLLRYSSYKETGATFFAQNPKSIRQVTKSMPFQFKVGGLSAQ